MLWPEARRRAIFSVGFPAFVINMFLRRNEVAHVEQAKEIDQLRANFFDVNINLNASCGIVQIEKMARPMSRWAVIRPGARSVSPSLNLWRTSAMGPLGSKGAERLDPFRAECVEFFAPQRD